MTSKTKKLWQLVMLLAFDLAILILLSSFSSAKTQALCLGCSGEKVACIQQNLSEIGLYSGKINGEFNFNTRKGIKNFQKSRGIEPSGEADYETVSALGLDSETVCFSSKAELLARCIQQSGCQSYPEMLEKGIEILNETDGAVTLAKYISEKFPDFYKKQAPDEPSSEVYRAALQSLELFAL